MDHLRLAYMPSSHYLCLGHRHRVYTLDAMANLHPCLSQTTFDGKPVSADDAFRSGLVPSVCGHLVASVFSGNGR
jgi:hypothetical protein